MSKFGGSGIFEELFNDIRRLLPDGSTILELGSGDVSTKLLSEHYTMFSVEDKPEWLGKYNSTYIHAPLINDWYSVTELKSKLPARYDLILVDGPTGEGHRFGFLLNLNLFKTDIPIVFDDTNRPPERLLAQQTDLALGRGAIIFHDRHAIIPGPTV